MDYLGTAGADTLTGNKGDDTFFGDAGNDTINATQGHDIVDGGTGNDRFNILVGNLARFDAWAGPRTYTITNSYASDSSGLLDSSLTSIERLTINTVGTGDYDDVIDIRGFVSTASFPTTVSTGAGNDTIYGSVMDDNILAGQGNNWVDAGDGNDSVTVVHDTSGSGGATLLVAYAGETITTTLGSQTNTIINAETVQIQNASLTTGMTIDASGANGYAGQLQFVNSMTGSDVFIGHDGSDVFGTNYLATVGDDTYIGNGGADWYDYAVSVAAMDGDVIADFDADDLIDLSFNNPTINGGGYLAFLFIGNNAFTGVAGQYRFDVDLDQGFTYLQVDSDGDGSTDLQLTIANGNFALAETSAGSNQLHLIGLSGGADGDAIIGGKYSNDSLYGQAGNDFLLATMGADFADGGEGYDQLRILLGNANRFDLATGSRTYTVGPSSVTDSSGTLNTSFANIEEIFLSAVNNGNYGDTINGSAGAIRLIIRAGGGDDTILGGGGDDDIATGLGINTVDAAAGFDIVNGYYDNSLGLTAFVTMVDGAIVTTVGGVAVNTISNAEWVFASGFYQNQGSVIDAFGLTGFDGLFLFGDTDGSNIAIGHDGADLFANGYLCVTGTDVYTGNGGADIYDYTYAVAGMDGDIITDFDDDDTIDLRFNDASQNGGGYLAYQFIGAADFSGVAGQYRYFAQGGKTYLQVDTNGDRVADETLTITNGQFALGETAPGSNLLHVIGVSGTAGVDTLFTTMGDDSVYAQRGNDIIYGSQGHDYVDGGAGSDRLFMNTGDASLFTLATGARTYTIGNGTISDSSGTIDTNFTSVERMAFSNVGNGNFDDTLDASGFVSASVAPLDVRLGNGDNHVIGSGGNDRIWTGFGSNIVDGGDGDDVAFSFADASGDITIALASIGGVLTIVAPGKTDQFTNVESVVAQGMGAGTVTLDASGYTNIPGVLLVLAGHDGNDIMIGSSGNDFFANATGQVSGFDVYTGNGGADIYDYTYAADSMNGDTITDFDIDDVIDLRGNNLEPGGSPVLANHFIGDAAFSHTTGEYRYQIDGTATIVQVDSDGDGIADQTLTIANGGFALAETATGSNILTLAAVINPLEGVVADGYVAGATLFVDVNDNGQRDAGEAWTTTDANGNFTLNVNQAGTIVASGGIDRGTGLANRMDLKAPFSASVVNPLTTLIAAVMAASAMSAAEAETAVKDALGLDPSLDILGTDLLAQGNNAAALDAQKAAAMIANLVTTAETVPGATGGTEAATVAALAGLVGSGPVDLTSSSTLTTILNTALPGVGGLGTVADQLSTEAAAIDAATSLAGIAAAQLTASLTGDDLANVLTGNDGDNVISGYGGNDTLYGLGGNDTLDGGIGADLMVGGLGNDLYIVDQSGDQVIELSGEGIDTVRSSVNHVLGANVENLELTGSAVSGTGNALDNIITGNALANILSGGDGNDILYGGGGNDRLFGGAGNDVLRGGDGVDFLTGDSGNDRFVIEDGTPIMTKQGPLTLDVVIDFQAGDRIDLSFLGGGDANSNLAGEQDFTWKGTNVSKDGGTVWYKTYDSMQGAEKALGADIDGVDGKSPYDGPVTIVFANHDGGSPDYAMALIGVGSLQAHDLIMG